MPGEYFSRSLFNIFNTRCKGKTRIDGYMDRWTTWKHNASGQTNKKTATSQPIRIWLQTNQTTNHPIRIQLKTNHTAHRYKPSKQSENSYKQTNQSEYCYNQPEYVFLWGVSAILFSQGQNRVFWGHCDLDFWPFFSSTYISIYNYKWLPGFNTLWINCPVHVKNVLVYTEIINQTILADNQGDSGIPCYFLSCRCSE